ncbi:MAG TPA: bifunctional adenosylcobinamide kinase/adenosylcobinamide-phosphate guanylyltransferase [Synechococcales cyanobacterium M55_K2018_004]|nr:bifunctional adenosylcobinamide kinase/adenosylcobinamide-phosphate guanylyltransferase [Synechococcales cyanobacterium M55_K2018_004]
MNLQRIVLVTGPARSGKSEWAELLAMQSQQPVVYVATAQAHPHDAEWQVRIAQHQRRRPPTWQTLSVPTDLVGAIASTRPDTCLLIDSLGTWLANVLDQDDATWCRTTAELLQQLQQATCPIICVAEETGWGVVPAYPLGRLFRDRLGQLTRQIGAIADAVYLVTGGYALNLTLLGTRLPPVALEETEKP